MIVDHAAVADALSEADDTLARRIWPHLGCEIRLDRDDRILRSQPAVREFELLALDVAREATEHLYLPADYFRVWVGGAVGDPSRIIISLYRDLPRYPMDAAEFERLFCHPPRDDDLHRINCAEAGAFGHIQCGWCPRHSKPRFMCGCWGRQAIAGDVPQPGIPDRVYMGDYRGGNDR